MNRVPGQPRFRPGDPLSLSELARTAEQASRVEHVQGGGVAGSNTDGGGINLLPQRPQEFLIRLAGNNTESGGSPPQHYYTWQTVRRNAAGTGWEVDDQGPQGEFDGPTPAIEVNGNINIETTDFPVVRAWLGDDGQSLYFEYSGLGDPVSVPALTVEDTDNLPPVNPTDTIRFEVDHFAVSQPETGIALIELHPGLVPPGWNPGASGGGTGWQVPCEGEIYRDLKRWEDTIEGKLVQYEQLIIWYYDEHGCVQIAAGPIVSRILGCVDCCEDSVGGSGSGSGMGSVCYECGDDCELPEVLILEITGSADSQSWYLYYDPTETLTNGTGTWISEYFTTDAGDFRWVLICLGDNTLSLVWQWWDEGAPGGLDDAWSICWYADLPDFICGPTLYDGAPTGETDVCDLAQRPQVPYGTILNIKLTGEVCCGPATGSYNPGDCDCGSLELNISDTICNTSLLLSNATTFSGDAAYEFTGGSGDPDEEDIDQAGFGVVLTCNLDGSFNLHPHPIPYPTIPEAVYGIVPTSVDPFVLEHTFIFDDPRCSASPIEVTLTFTGDMPCSATGGTAWEGREPCPPDPVADVAGLPCCPGWAFGETITFRFSTDCTFEVGDYTEVTLTYNPDVTPHTWEGGFFGAGLVDLRFDLEYDCELGWTVLVYRDEEQPARIYIGEPIPNDATPSGAYEFFDAFPDRDDVTGESGYWLANCHLEDGSVEFIAIGTLRSSTNCGGGSPTVTIGGGKCTTLTAGPGLIFLPPATGTIGSAPTISLDGDLAAIADLEGFGYLRRTGYQTWTLDTTIPWASLSGVPSTFAPSAHASTHASGGSDPVSLAASQITSGTLDIARIPTGTSSTTVCIGNDPRLSDARTPTTHTHDWSEITGEPAFLTGNETITLSGDVTGSGTTAITATIGAGAVTLAKMADVATGVVFYRKTAGTGSPEVQTLATLKTDLGLTGTNSGDQTITLTGDVTGSGTGSFAATIANDAVTYAKMQNVSATDRILGRSTAGAGNVEEIVCTSPGRNLIDDATVADQRTTLGLGTAATVNTGTTGGTAPLHNTTGHIWTGDHSYYSTGSASVYTIDVQPTSVASGLIARFGIYGVANGLRVLQNSSSQLLVDLTAAFTTLRGVAHASTYGLDVLSSGTLASNKVLRVGISGLTNGFTVAQDSSSNVVYRFETGNVVVGGGTSPTGGGQCLVLSQASDPTGIASNTCLFFGKDVAGTCESHTMDEAGNITQLSAQAMDGPAWLYDADDPLPHVVKKVNVYTGVIRWINEGRRARLQDMMLTGEDMSHLTLEQRRSTHVEYFEPTEDWEENQDRHQLQRQQEIAVHIARVQEHQQQLTTWQRLPLAQRSKIERPTAPETAEPEPYVRKEMPQHLQQALALANEARRKLQR
jgi:hypothetical protein